jgi:hypothetical protein
MCGHTACVAGSDFASNLVLKGADLEALGVHVVKNAATAASVAATTAAAAAVVEPAAAAAAVAAMVVGEVVATAATSAAATASSGAVDGSSLLYDPCAIFHGPLAKAKLQTLALSVLVAMEMLKVTPCVFTIDTGYRL